MTWRISVLMASFINDFARKVWLYFLTKKLEAFSNFKELKAIVENQTSKKIKCLGLTMEENSMARNLISSINNIE